MKKFIVISLLFVQFFTNYNYKLQAQWVEDFESYAPNTWPSTWSPDANANDISTNFIDNTFSYTGNNSLRIHGSIGGCWEALAYKALEVSPPYEIEFYLRNGNDLSGGCHQRYATVGIRKGTSWANPGRGFISFMSDNTILALNEKYLGNYSNQDWYKIKIKYERPSPTTVKLSYWINSIFKGDTIAELFAEEEQMTNLLISSGDGTVWYDDISVHPAILQTSLDLKVFLEGPFIGTEMANNISIQSSFPLSQPFNVPPWNYNGGEVVTSLPNIDIVDWVLVEIRDAQNPESASDTTVLQRRVGFLLKDGTLVDLDGASPLEFDVEINHDLYVCVYHRNHLSVMSSNALAESGGVYSYDFTPSSDQAYGFNSQKELAPGVWGMIASDGNADGIINTGDKSGSSKGGSWITEAGESGYMQNDYNLDNEVNNSDKNNFWIENEGMYSSVPNTFNCGNYFPYDGKAYQTVQIGEQCWFKENLNVGDFILSSIPQSNNQAIEKYCYGEIETNCEAFGGLYQWEEMMDYITTSGAQGICPEGWHIPTHMDWMILEGEADSQYDYPDSEWLEIGWRGYDAGKNLKSANGWIDPGNGMDIMGFNGYPTGTYDGESFIGNNSFAGYWTSLFSYGEGFARRLDFDQDKIFFDSDGTGGIGAIAVRCIQNVFNPNLPPEQPSFPSPENESVDQSLNCTLSWICNDPENDPLTFDVYFGTEPDPSIVYTPINEFQFDPGLLTPNTAYFWRIVARDDHSNETSGPIWWFSTSDNLPPNQLSYLIPENGSHDQSTNSTLAWTCSDPENDAIMYDVYLDVVDPPLVLISYEQSETTYDATLELNTEYFWQIVAKDQFNTAFGPIWDFTTESNIAWQCGESFVDNQNSLSYESIQIGSQCWMKENLNFETGNSWCFNNSPVNCDTYGRLYDWETIMNGSSSSNAVPSGVQGICPDGWHVPSDAEWCILTQFIDPSVNCDDSGLTGTNAGLKMKSESGWLSGNGNNDSGFNGLPSGWRTDGGGFDMLGLWTYWYSSTESSTSNAWNRGLGFLNNGVFRNDHSKQTGYSLRCVKTQSNLAPEQPINVSPTTGSSDLNINILLSWECDDLDNDPLTFDIFLGTEPDPPLFEPNVTEFEFYLNTLIYETDYYWRIIAYDDHSNFTVGPIWSFSTRSDISCPNIPTIEISGQVYNTIKIGNQCWLKENLNHESANSHCYNYNQTYCDQYGRLYNWETAMEVCPSGWHLPSDEEWKQLEGEVDSQFDYPDPIWDEYYERGYDAGKNIKSSNGWFNGNSTDPFGFSALPGGIKTSWDGMFIESGQFANFWTATGISPSSYIGRKLLSEDGVYRGIPGNIYSGLSVRCIKDASMPGNNPPFEPSNPVPYDNSPYRSINSSLIWTCTDQDFDPLTFEIYFGTDNPPSNIENGTNIGNEFIYDPPTPLLYNTKYFWQIVASDNQSNQTVSPVWSFNTVAEFGMGDPCPGIPTVTFQGQDYNTVQIGDQCWFKENMNWETGTSYCYEDIQSNCNTYGRLYDWETAMIVCPTGWHLPADDEWTILADYLGGDEIAGGKMKETGSTYWNWPNMDATNESGFSALPGGFYDYYSPLNFYFIEERAYFWSSSFGPPLTAKVARKLTYSWSSIYGEEHIPVDAMSVRCIKD